jgi:hypothetical protein
LPVRVAYGDGDVLGHLAVLFEERQEVAEVAPMEVDPGAGRQRREAPLEEWQPQVHGVVGGLEGDETSKETPLAGPGRMFWTTGSTLGSLSVPV